MIKLWTMLILENKKTRSNAMNVITHLHIIGSPNNIYLRYINKINNINAINVTMLLVAMDI